MRPLKSPAQGRGFLRRRRLMPVIRKTAEAHGASMAAIDWDAAVTALNSGNILGGERCPPYRSPPPVGQLPLTFVC